MSNKPRICEPELTYHVYSRCITGLPYIESDYWKDVLEEIVAWAMDKYFCKCHGFAFEDNHFHLIIHTQNGGGSISRIMQFIKSRFTLQYNKETKRFGPLWNERFGDKIVQLQENPVGYFLWLLWYLAYNCVKSGKVKNPLQYRYSSIGHYLGYEARSQIPVTLGGMFIHAAKTELGRMNLLRYFHESFCRAHNYSCLPEFALSKT